MNNINVSRTWVCKHAREICERIKDYPTDRPIMMKMGYGPSGLAHLGTLTETIRTCMVAKALRQMQPRPVIVLSFCDNLDGMRKVPPNLPNQDMLKRYIGHPLNAIPDPFGTCESFAEYNINELRKRLIEFGYPVEDYRPTRDNQFSIEKVNAITQNREMLVILRASDMYYSGSYNTYLQEMLTHYQDILDIILPDFGEERRRTYSPFMPISRKTGRVLEEGVREYYPNKGTILVEEDGELSEIPVINGECKLQWKIDFALQWITYKIDYEMSGKDIVIGTCGIAKAVTKALGYNPPIAPMYEMFLAEDGTRMSKTKGNGLSLEQLVRYSSPEVIKHFMFLSPESAKRLDMQKMPSYIDSFIADLEDFNNPDSKRIKEENPIWYFENTELQNPHFTASGLLKLIKGKAWTKIEDIVQFFEQTRGITLTDLELRLIRAIYNFYHEQYADTKFEKIPENARTYLLEFIKHLSENPDLMQTRLKEIGDKAVQDGVFENTRLWYAAIYKSVFGAPNGPKLGGVFALLGVEESAKLIRDICEEKS